MGTEDGASLRQRKPKSPCLKCSLNPSLCICSLLPILQNPLKLKTKISLIIHSKELKRTTNSGRLALHCLLNSEMRVRGERLESANDDRCGLDLSDLLTQDYETLLFYPSEDAVELNKSYVARLSKPIQLIVPDGNWRQASKVHTRHPELEKIPRVMLKIPNLAKFHLRAESSEFGMSTLEAIARAMAVIEGDEVGEKLLAVYRAKLERTLIGRGKISS